MDVQDPVVADSLTSGKGAVGTDKPAPQRLTPRHVMVVLAGILICFGPCTLVYNTWSLFVVPVCESLGAVSSQFTIMVTIIFLSSALFSPIAGNLMEKYDLRLVLGASVVLCGVGILLCATYTQIWQFYVSGVLEGIGVVSLMYLAVGTLVNRWYKSHIGFLVGLCVAMTGLGGALWAMCGGVIIGSYGYHAAYIFFGTMCLVLGLPATLLLIRSYPSDVGLSPYGESEEGEEVTEEGLKQWGVSAKLAFAMPVFFILALTIGLCNGVAQAGNLLPTYLYHLADIGAAGLTPEIVVIMASVIASCLMISQCLAKVYLGAIADKSILAALCLACGCGAIGVLLCWQGYQLSGNLVYVGSFLFGVLFASTNVLGPTITRYLFGQREYTKIYSRVTFIINLFPAVAVTGFAALSEVGWDLEFTVVLVIIALIFIGSLLTVKLGKNIEQTYEVKPE